MDPLTASVTEGIATTDGEAASDGLELFLRTKKRDAEEQIIEILALIDDVLKTFQRSFLNDRTWPYQLVNGKRREREGKKNYSFSTVAMITFALSLGTGRIKRSILVPRVVWSPPPVGERLEKERKETRQAIDTLVRRAVNRLILESQELKGSLSTSGTYGNDDPFTLTWLLEVLAGEGAPKHWARFREALKKTAWERVRDVLGDPDGSNRVLRLDEKEIVPHSFPLLRILQLGQALSSEDNKEHLSRHEDVSEVREWLHQRVHMQLSESQIPAGGFDAADLVFALEGWILTSPEEPPLGLVARAFEVLEQSQKRTPYWRPLRPFKVSRQGLVLLPQSVEIANSILRICNTPLLDREGYLSRHVELLRNYNRWLLGRIYRGSFTDGEDGRFVGWESEHTYALDRIHLWQTSQVLIFLQHYIAMLQQHHIARRSLELAGFVWSRDQTRTVPVELRLDEWKDWTASEPLKGVTLERRYLVYEQIHEDFVQPELAVPGSGSHSMLLYGPPGTGKSTIAEKIAETLGFPLITITPSDFITGGGEAVEARAKAIFEMLGVQTELVVLFDEIDNLLLDRDSALYREQSDVFKLLTPGMLTKLAGLAKTRSVLFVIATNYFERIDPAITRPGRIDARYPVLPPSMEQRKRFLGEKLTEERWTSLKGDQDEVAKVTVRFTYRELKDLVRHVVTHHGKKRGAALARVLIGAAHERPALIALKSYRLRLDLHRVDEQAREPVTLDSPWEEFALLAYLELEATGAIPKKPEWIRKAVKLAIDEGAVRDSRLAATLEAAL
jgi:hypothetical protein